MSEEINIPEESSKKEIPNSNKNDVNENISSPETIASFETEEQLTTYNLPLTTQNMEVHHHPDLHHKPKKWKEYLLEFLMIFLAVTMGFFAENIRENISNKERLHNNIQSLVSDLQSDLAMYDSAIAFNNGHRQMIDSIINGLNTPNGNLRTTYFMARQLTMGSSVVSPNTKTYEQMKSSGDMRLIKKQMIADSIALYYQWTKKFDYWSDLQKQRISDVIDVNDKVFNTVIFYNIIKNPVLSSVPENVTLITHEQAALNQVTSKYQYYFGMLNLMNQRCSSASIQAKQLLALIKKEYHLNDE